MALWEVLHGQMQVVWSCWERNDKQLGQNICHPAATKEFTPEMMPWSVI